MSDHSVSTFRVLGYGHELAYLTCMYMFCASIPISNLAPPLPPISFVLSQSSYIFVENLAFYFDFFLKNHYYGNIFRISIHFANRRTSIISHV